MRGGHVGTVSTTLLLIGGFVAKAGAAGSFEPMTHMMRNLFTTTTDSTSTTETDCPTEIDGCNADDECILCTQSYVEAVEGCFASATGSTCDDVEEAVCCAVPGCEDNAALSDLLGCVFADTCPVDIGDCAADGSRAISGSGTTTDTDSPSDLSTPTTTSTSDAGSTTDTTTYNDRAISGSDTTTDTTTPGGAVPPTDTTSMTTSETDCPTETSACSADLECAACDESAGAALEGCFAASDVSTCDGILEAVCCAVDDGCEENDALIDVVGCLFSTVCSIDIGDCAAGGSRAISGSDTTTDTDGTDTTDTDGTDTTDADGTDATDTDGTDTTDTDGTDITDTDGTDTTDTDSTDGTNPFPVGDDQEDGEDSTEDADATNTVNSATPSVAAMGGSTVVWLIAAAAPGLWRRFQ